MKILSLDGGGVFGIGQACILSKIDTTKFDLIVGTSIGAVNGAYLSFTKDASSLPRFFRSAMPQIFTNDYWRTKIFWMRRYSDDSLNNILQQSFPIKFGALVHQPLLATAANLNSKRLKVFNSLDGVDAPLPLWEVLRMAVAAETYFAPWQGFGDGGVFANNPVMVAIAGASRMFKMDPDQLEICSIGTGQVPDRGDAPDGNTGMLGWGEWLIKADLEGSSSTMHEYFAESMNLKKYLRVQFVRKPDWRMDCPDHMAEAEQFWQQDILQAVQDVRSFLGQ